MTLRIKPLTTSTIKAELLKTFKEAIEGDPVITRRDPTRLMTLRASQLPFCPLQTVIVAAKYGPNSPLGFYGSYFTKVGTAVHEVMQAFMGKTGKFLANWKCRECGKLIKLSHDHTHCGFDAEYEEILINYKGLVGHVDAVYRDSQGRYWVLDFKTTSLAQAGNKEQDPGIVYKEQVRAYAWALRGQYGLDIAGIIDMFLPRDNPTNPTFWTHEMTEEDFVQVGRDISKYKKQHKFSFEAETMSDLKQMWKARHCRSEADKEDFSPFCGFINVCSGKDPSVFINAFKQGRKRGYIPIKALVEKHGPSQ